MKLPRKASLGQGKGGKRRDEDSPARYDYFRFCIDYRRVNAVAKRESYPLSMMNECIGSLGGTNVFSTVYANCGYWQLPVREKVRPMTLFNFHAGL